MAPYRPSGRSGRSGRATADNDIFEGLPVKQWTTMKGRVSLAPPASEQAAELAQDKWADPPMPRDYQLLLPHTQALLRIARSGKVGTKRKAQQDPDVDGDDYGERDVDAAAEEVLAKAANVEDRGFIAKKWQHTPETALVPEHLHWEFLAKRRKGLPNFYHGLLTEVAPNGLPQLAKRRTRVQLVIDVATGESAIYEVLALEGQVLENELPAESQLPSTALAPGTTIEGLGTANDEGIIVVVPANIPAIARRARPPPKKKGGPGRGKKRVTFINADGTSYTAIVPNATKIVPKAGQTVKHVAKGEDAGKDVTTEEAAKLAAEAQPNQGGDGEQDGAEGEGEGDGEGDDDEEGDDDDEGEDDNDREDGEIPKEDANAEAASPTKTKTSQSATPAAPADSSLTELATDIEMTDPPGPEPATAEPDTTTRDPSSSPEMPLAHKSRLSVDLGTTGIDLAATELETIPGEDEAAAIEPDVGETADTAGAVAETNTPLAELAAAAAKADGAKMATDEAKADADLATFDDGEEDLLGSLERHLEG